MTDSQLSQVIREAKMNFSQTSKNGTFEDDSLSQNTKAMIRDGNYVLPGLSQGGIELLELNMEGLESVRAQIQQNVETSPEIPESSMTESKKKRTDRIPDEDPEKSADVSIDIFEESPEPFESFPTDMNKSLDPFSAPESPQDGLMNCSFNDSMMTLTQRQFDSQSPPIPFLRARTVEEQKTHKMQKELEKSVRRASKGEGHRSDFTVPKEKERRAPEKSTPNITDPGEQDVFAEEIHDMDPKTAGSSIDLIPQDETSLEVKVAEAKSKKISDFVGADIKNIGRYLWTRMGVSVPFRAKWNVPDAQRQLRLRVRFVHYDQFCPIERAIRVAHSDVQKCQKHTDEELTAVPYDSFFYITSRDVLWVPAASAERRIRGHSFTAECPATNEIEFELKFCCQEKCMGVEERRKTMCLVIFLEDEKGTPIKHCVFKEVRIVAYPRRDFKNFIAKGVDTGCPPEQLSTKRPARFRGESHLRMFNVTNAQMLPSTSSRKRTAEWTVEEEIDVVSTPCNYEKKLMLGASYRSPPEQRMELDENVERPAKKRRTGGTIRMIAVDELKYQAVLSFLAEMSRSERASANREIRPLQHPFSLQSSVTPEMRIDIWLNTFGKQSYVQLFQVRGIHCVQDLITHFEADPMIFSKLGLDPEDVERAQTVFFNFYHVFQAECLNLPHYQRFM